MWRWVLFIAFLTSTVVVAQSDVSPRDTSDWTPRARLLLAQSCVGEAGFDSSQTGECAAIGWVYVKRVAQMRRRGHTIDLAEMIRRYSQPIRHRRRLWLVTLNVAANQPRGWPRRWPPWETHYRERWVNMLAMVDRWAAGEEPNVCPSATHFGATTDIPGPRMVRVGCRRAMRNRFYRVR